MLYPRDRRQGDVNGPSRRRLFMHEWPTAWVALNVSANGARVVRLRLKPLGKPSTGTNLNIYTLRKFCEPYRNNQWLCKCSRSSAKATLLRYTSIGRYLPVGKLAQNGIFVVTQRVVWNKDLRKYNVVSFQVSQTDAVRLMASGQN